MPLFNPSTAGAASFRGCLATLSADQTAINATGAGYTIPFDGADVYDTDSIHDPVTNNTRLTIPSGVTKVRITGNVQSSGHTSATNVISLVRLFKNGSLDYAGSPSHQGPGATGAPTGTLVSPVLEVVAGDYFELGFFVTSDTSITIEAERTSFGVEIVA